MSTAVWFTCNVFFSCWITKEIWLTYSTLRKLLFYSFSLLELAERPDCARFTRTVTENRQSGLEGMTRQLIISFKFPLTGCLNQEWVKQAKQQLAKKLLKSIRGIKLT